MDGDENTRFFHGFVNNKKIKNRINGLMIRGVWNTNVEEVKQEVLRFYQNKFRERWTSRPKLINPKFKTLNTLERTGLESKITTEEIKNAIWACGSEKAPGPDGFTFKFLKRQWDLIQGDIIKFVDYFERFGRLERGCNSSFITLVPKCKDPSSLGDYRPISLIGCLYKIVSKILATRLKAVIGNVVDEVQFAYVEGRYILDGPLIINEVC